MFGLRYFNQIRYSVTLTLFMLKGGLCLISCYFFCSYGAGFYTGSNLLPNRQINIFTHKTINTYVKLYSCTNFIFSKVSCTIYTILMTAAALMSHLLFWWIDRSLWHCWKTTSLYLRILYLSTYLEKIV